jgi:two-component system, OmpR family, phosphate regulon sensor histidine kinase PhoR
MFMMLSVTHPPGYFHELAEGIILVERGRVVALNKTAAMFLSITGDVVGLPLIGVVRDHRLEQAYLEQREIEVEKAGRILLAKPITGGLSLRDMSPIKHAQETARELLAVLSHELRTPVTTIRATLEALQSDLPDKLREKFLHRAQAEGERLVRLLEDLTVDVRPPQYRRIFVPDVISRATSLVQRTFAERQVELLQEVAPLTVWADADKFLQVLINMLENAAIHGPNHKTVTLKVCLSDNPSYAHIIVQDQGEPLAKDAFEHLFEPHARGTSVKAKGTGLGLYIVRSIAERWGGEAWGQALAGGNEFGISVQIK